MRLTRELGAALVASVSIFPPTVVAMLDCTKIFTDGVEFNFEKLGGLKQVTDIREGSVGPVNTTFNIDICRQLKIPNFGNQEEPCKGGTRICAVELLKEKDTVIGVIPIVQSGEVSNGNHIHPDPTLLNPSEDSNKDGVRVELTGTKFQGTSQRAIIEFLCQREDDEKRSMHGMEDDEDGGDGEGGSPDGDDGEGGPEEWEKFKETEDGEGGKLALVSWDKDQRENTLRLEWHTKYACKDAAGGGDNDSGSKGGWGFFSWFFFLFFLGVIGYFGFFAWVNYSKYGAQGWDLVPHSDTIRDIPYILGDWGRKVVSTFTGGPSRGGYSAV